MRKEHLWQRELGLLLIFVLIFSTCFADLQIKSKAVDKEEQRADISEEVTPGNPVRKSDGTVVWDTIYLGRYIQYDTNNDGVINQQDMAAPILWRVLSTNDDASDVLLITEQVIVFAPYMNESQQCTWETSTIRSWLNGYGSDENSAKTDYTHDNFIDTAFSKEEQSALLNTKVHTEPLEVNISTLAPDIQGGNDTTDKLYLPSWEDSTNETYGFSDDISYDQSRLAGKTKRCLSDPYVPDAQGIGNASYALRNPGIDNGWNAFCDEFGALNSYGNPCNSNQGIRPMLHINLKELKDGNGESLWAMASKVTSALERTTEVSKSVPSNPSYENGCSEYDIVTFGSYYQEDTNQDGVIDTQDEKLPIKWRVLSQKVGEDSTTYRLISEDILDFQPFHDTKETVTWEDCSLRQWLNQDFYQTAFNAMEQNAISSTLNYNYDYQLVLGTATQKELLSVTSDKVSLLDLCNDAISPELGFRPPYAQHNDWTYSYSRVSKPTKYAVSHNQENLKYLPYCNDYTVWHFRSMYSSDNENIVVSERGLAYKTESLTAYYGVRPVIYVNIEKLPDKSLPCTLHITRRSDLGDVMFEDPDYQIPVITTAPTATVTPVLSATVGVSPTVGLTPNPTLDPTTVPTVSPVVSMPVSPTVSEAASPTVSPKVSEAVSPTVEPKVSATVSPTLSPKVSEAASPTLSPKVSEAVSPTVELKVSVPASPTLSPKVSEEASPTVSITMNPTATPVISKVAEITATPAVSKPTPKVSAVPKPTITKKPTNTNLKKGTRFQDSKCVYEITDVKRKYVKLVKPVSKKIKSVKVEAKVKYKGTQFKVVSINTKAFRNCKKLKTVTIGGNVSYIGSYAFDNCSNLRTIRIESKKVKNIGKKAFHSVNKKVKVYIPKSKRNAYKKMLYKRGISKSTKIVTVP